MLSETRLRIKLSTIEPLCVVAARLRREEFIYVRSKIEQKTDDGIRIGD